jgi:hypothetical protein
MRGKEWNDGERRGIGEGKERDEGEGVGRRGQKRDEKEGEG